MGSLLFHKDWIPTLHCALRWRNHTPRSLGKQSLASMNLLHAPQARYRYRYCVVGYSNMLRMLRCPEVMRAGSVDYGSPRLGMRMVEPLRRVATCNFIRLAP